MRSTASLHDVALVRSSAGSAYLDPSGTRVEPTGKALNAANEVSFDSVGSPKVADLDVARVYIILNSLLPPSCFALLEVVLLSSGVWELSDFETSTG